jgi:short-subunit dehydrogenase
MLEWLQMLVVYTHRWMVQSLNDPLVCHTDTFIFLEDESERLIHDINVGGVIKGDKVAVMHLMKRKGGVIINTASIAGIVSGP